MISLPEVTIICITTKDYGPSIQAIKKSLEQIIPAEVILFSDVHYDDPDFSCISIPRLKSVREYSEFLLKEAGKYVETEFLLVIQHDGYPINASAWTDEFLEYDYIGAPWVYKDGRNVGNGGFSLRSKKLHTIFQTDEFIESNGIYSPEDECIGRLYRHYLEDKYGIRIAPDEVAAKFSYECQRPIQNTFGFHNYFHNPYKEPIILKRTGAMGDVIMMEPVMEHFHKNGYRVILDCLPHYYNLFANHNYPIEHLQFLNEDVSEYRVINLDMSYETEPRELVLKTYYKTCGIESGEMRNSRLNFFPTPDTKLFERYIVLHLDDTDMPHRNIRGLDWGIVVEYLRNLDYQVFQISNRDGIKIAPVINTVTENMMAYVISGADYFIGIDSGPGHIAIASGIKSMLFFGSVNPKLRYPDLSNITVMQQSCPLAMDGCYHSLISVRGTDCKVDIQRPPCIEWTADKVIERLDKMII